MSKYHLTNSMQKALQKSQNAITCCTNYEMCPGLLAAMCNSIINPAAMQFRLPRLLGLNGGKIAFVKSCRNPTLSHSCVQSDCASNADRNAPITELDFRPIRWGFKGTNQAARYGWLETVYIVHTWVFSSNFRPVKTALRRIVSKIRIRACNYTLY